MSPPDAAARYRAYLASFGIADPGDRVVEQIALDRGSVRFFAYADGGGLRLKAAVTPTGIVTSGARAEDDWHGFLAGIGDAAAAAERIAWLETDASTQPHGLPAPPWTAVVATMSQLPDGSIRFVASFLPSGIPIPQRWTVIAPPHASAEITFSTES